MVLRVECAFVSCAGDFVDHDLGAVLPESTKESIFSSLKQGFKFMWQSGLDGRADYIWRSDDDSWACRCRRIFRCS